MSPLVRRAAAVAGAVLSLALASACVQLPDEGPVEVGAQPPGTDQDSGIQYAPRAPQRGESSTEIVQHFLDAMLANPIQTSVARQFLTSAAAESWNPSARIITYAERSTPRGVNLVDVTLTGANWLDSRGVWRGPVDGGTERLRLEMATEDAEWRINGAPDALLVTDTWFAERYRQVLLYFFDPEAEVLIPEPVFVPRGEQLTTSLVRGLLAGPPGTLRDELPSFFPRGARLDDISVPVVDGVAVVKLSGELTSMDAESLDLMTAQLAWTLRQNPEVDRIRVEIGGDPVTVPGGGTEFSVNIGARFDPAGAYAWQELFGLQGGRMVSVVGSTVTPVAGPFGVADLGLRDLSIDLAGETVVGVTRSGTSLLQAPVQAGGPGDVRRVVSGARDLLHPAWDLFGRLWVLDRTSTGAQLSWLDDAGARHPVRVPGITGERVVDFLVSRDGSRLVAALDRPGGDVVVISRLVRSRQGFRGTPARVIEHGSGKPIQIRDLAWRAPTEVLVLSSVSPSLSEVRTLSVDGSPALRAGVLPTELLRDDVRRLVGSPTTDRPSWVVTAEGAVIQLAPVEAVTAPPSGLRRLTHVG